jgi:RHS repeat-associated protein
MVFPPAGAATASVASYAVTTAYGIPLILQTDATLTPILKYLNPFLYRGYVYDIETTLYYLQSRFYNPEQDYFIPDDMHLAYMCNSLRVPLNNFHLCPKLPH